MTIGRIVALTEQIAELKQRVRLLELQREALIRGASAGVLHHRGETVTPDPVSINDVLDAVAEAGEIDANELAAKLSISYDGARLRLARYAKRGLLVRVSRGRYRNGLERQMAFHVNGEIRVDREENDEDEDVGKTTA